MAEIRNLIQQSVELSSWQEIYFQQSRLDSHEMKAALDLICCFTSGITSSIFHMAGTSFIGNKTLVRFYYFSFFFEGIISR